MSDDVKNVLCQKLYSAKSTCEGTCREYRALEVGDDELHQTHDAHD